MRKAIKVQSRGVSAREREIHEMLQGYMRALEALARADPNRSWQVQYLTRVCWYHARPLLEAGVRDRRTVYETIKGAQLMCEQGVMR